MTAALGSTRFRLGLCFRRRAGFEAGADETGPTAVVTGLTTVVVTIGPVAGDVELPVDVDVPPGRPDCDPPAALLEGAVMLVKSASESLLIVARYICAPF